MNPFEVLELSPGASSDEVKAAYHRLAKQWHPDRYTGAEKVEAESRFRSLAEAFTMLKDQGRRAEIERQITSEASSPAVAGAPSGVAGSRPLAERTAEDWLDEAKAAMESQDYSRALGLVHYAVRLDAGRAESHRLMADLLEKTGGDPRALVKALETVIRLDPKDADAMIRLADVFQRLGMQARAATVRESARGIAPNHKAFRPMIPKKVPPASEPRSGFMTQLSALAGRLFRKG
jgi:tetratricopeptide (TPR) repeat protein